MSKYWGIVNRGGPCRSNIGGAISATPAALTDMRLSQYARLAQNGGQTLTPTLALARKVPPARPAAPHFVSTPDYAHAQTFSVLRYCRNIHHIICAVNSNIVFRLTRSSLVNKLTLTATII